MALLNRLRRRSELTVDAMARLRADPWQWILTATSAAVIAGVTLFLFSDLTLLSIGLLLGFAIVVAVRVRLPIAALAGQGVLLLLAAGFDERLVGPGLALALISLISLAIERRLRTVLPAVLVMQVVLYWTLVLLSEGPVQSIDSIEESSLFGIVCGTAGIAALGVAIRSQRQYIEAISQRAIHAEETREAEARQMVSEERLRIARDLHDSVAHHISVVSVYTGLARTTLDPTDTRTGSALASAQAATRSVLEELQHIVHILRDPEPAAMHPQQPAPDFTAIEDLVRSFSDAGLTVDFDVSGQPENVSIATGLVAYRVVQEALTNARKYGTGRASVDIVCGKRTMAIRVTNEVGNASGAGGTGHGLIGMRERVRMIDGSLDHTIESGMFTLRAVLPSNPQSAGATTTSIGASNHD